MYVQFFSFPFIYELCLFTRLTVFILESCVSCHWITFYLLAIFIFCLHSLEHVNETWKHVALLSKHHRNKSITDNFLYFLKIFIFRMTLKLSVFVYMQKYLQVPKSRETLPMNTLQGETRACHRSVLAFVCYSSSWHQPNRHQTCPILIIFLQFFVLNDPQATFQ